MDEVLNLGYATKVLLWGGAAGQRPDSFSWAAAVPKLRQAALWPGVHRGDGNPIVT